MKNILTQIFVTLGVLFLIVIAVGVYLFVADPYDLKPILFGSETTKVPSNESNETSTKVVENSTQSSTTSAAVTGGFQLSAAQKQALVGLGIDPAAVPSSISPTQETCFVGVLGEARVLEIKAGAVPNTIEFFKAKSCI